MASKITALQVTSLNANDVSFTSGAGAQNNLRKFIDHLEGGLNGAHTIRVAYLRDNATAGAVTVTLASVAAGTVLLINGVPFTAKGSAATTGNDEFDISGGTDTLDAAALAAAINASTTTGIVGVVTATSLNAVVTITAAQAGRGSNAITVESLGVVATGTFTFTSVDNNDACAVNGVTLTAKTTVSDATVEFAVGASNAATATNFAALINSTATSALITRHVRALARSNVVHLFAKYGGVAGNAITTTSADADIVAAQARLAGGTLAQYEGAQATTALAVVGADGGTYRTTINGVDIDVTGTNGDDAATFTDIAAAINASTDPLVAGFVRATDAEDGTGTLMAIRGGHQGNAITSAVTGTGYSVGGARLTGGAVPTVLVFAGGSATPLQSGARMTGGGADTAITLTL